MFTWKRAVLKVGSSLIAPDSTHCSAKYLLAIAQFITASREAGKEVLVVSSGSVAAGRNSVKVNHQPSIAEKQAMAAIGQTRMMANWQRFFDFPCAQVLLSAEDLRDRTRYVNIASTIRELLTHHALPIINENDTVVTDELKVGDNDNLAAYTALVAQADTLIICSDVDGLYSADPRCNPQASLISQVDVIDEATYQLAGGAGTKMGTGGMQTKLQAAEKCMHSGIQTLIVNGRKPAVFASLQHGKAMGTLFKPKQSSRRARQLWIHHTLKSKGCIKIDEGAAAALTDHGASLLPSGVSGCEGEFRVGDAVSIECNGRPVAKGLVLFSAAELTLAQGRRTCELSQVLGYQSNGLVVHRDDMVVF
ncbi:glutamate 5-kinase [Alteromonas ponticola]|uniref:Glutamate 5-kinase n=1 Tax=Alteromonas aquimaris TaxID=2998417 RepID=A0ABT3P872_9ALTE|nr:glutamate 5-kinase [Alteromonas aquimaris]MCW8108944.1 glutamate 5-kinase [Alteromonas aquimaris]